MSQVAITDELRSRLVEVTLQWESTYGIAPSITSVLSEYDAARLVGCSPTEYGSSMAGRTAVSKGHDFEYAQKRYQVKANRPSGKPGSFVTLVSKAKNYYWDYLIWILYNSQYEIQEAWLWGVEAYRLQFHEKNRLSPHDLRQGKKLFGA